MKFFALDVETANADMSSICAVGLATFESGELISEWESFVDPQDYFDGINTSIHGIDEEMVAGAPTYDAVAGTIEKIVGDGVVVTHTHFDRVAMHQAALRWNVDPPCYRWLDSAKVARRTWLECSRSGYGLADVCKRIGYEFRHHNALEDAKACGRIMLAAMTDSGLDLEGMLARVIQPIDTSGGSSRSAIQRDGNPEGDLFGEILVFTGALSIPRREAADMAAAIGCTVAPGVTKKTTLLVVGDTDVQRLAGHEKSTKHRKAEELAASGSQIRIICESDFKQLVSMA